MSKMWENDRSIGSETCSGAGLTANMMMMGNCLGVKDRRSDRKSTHLEEVIHWISVHLQLVKSLDEIPYISTESWVHLVCHFFLTAPPWSRRLLFFFSFWGARIWGRENNSFFFVVVQLFPQAEERNRGKKKRKVSWKRKKEEKENFKNDTITLCFWLGSGIYC